MPKRATKKRDGLVKRGKYWSFRVVVNGARKTVSTGCEERRDAERRRTELVKDINDGKFGWKPEPVKVVPTIEQYLALSADVLASQKGGTRAVRMLQRLCVAFPHRQMQTLTKTECQGFLHGRRTFGKAALNSVRGEHIACKRFWNRAIEDHLLTENPWRFKMQPEVPRGRVMSFAEQAVLFATLTPSVLRAVIVALFTGLRNYELCHITRTDCDFAQGVIYVRAEVGKLGKARTVPMPREAAEAIQAQMRAFDVEDLGKQFPRTRDVEVLFPYAATSLIAIFNRAVKAVTLPRLTIHDLRRTFGTRCAENNVPMRVLQKWLGHAKIEMTAKFYSNVDEMRLDHIEGMLTASRAGLAKAQLQEDQKSGVNVVSMPARTKSGR